MSEPERSDRGAITESPTLLPGHAAGPTERVEENQDAPEVAPSVELNGSTSVGPTPRPQAPPAPRVGDTRPGTSVPAPTAGEDEAPAKKRRRRRGGRGRSKGGGADRVDSPRPESPRQGGARKPATPRYVDAGLPL